MTRTAVAAVEPEEPEPSVSTYTTATTDVTITWLDSRPGAGSNATGVDGGGPQVG